MRLGIDIGGTFTDIVAVDPETGATATEKCLNTPEDLQAGVVSGIQRLLAAAGRSAEPSWDVVHATTLATNAIIERKGASVGFVTTAGFRDLLGLRREERYDQYDLLIDPPAPLVPRERCFEIDERVGADGDALLELDAREAERIAGELSASGIKSVAVCLLHSYKNPEHEQLLMSHLAQLDAELDISLSSDVLPEIGEFERASSTVINAYVRPLVREYLERLTDGMRGLGLSGEMSVMLSSGGIVPAETAKRYPVRIVESGPAAGVVGAAHFGRSVGCTDVLAFDMGGTTAKLSVVEELAPMVSSELEVARLERLKMGSGLPIKTPSIHLLEIGAGGGSIARVDELGLVKVGPESAGASPGPACYGLGGAQPTVTDADLLLGYISPDAFAGGAFALDVAAAGRAMEAALGEVADDDPLKAAAGIYDVVNETMSLAALMHIIERGRDPRRYSLVATGGAGPVHAYEVARKLRLPRLVIPVGAGVASAFGLLCAPRAFDAGRSYVTRIDATDWAQVNELLEELEQLARGSAGETAVTHVSRSADMWYQGQGSPINVVLPDGELSGASASGLRTAFEEAYLGLYGHICAEEVPVEAVNWKVQIAGAATAVEPGGRGGGEHGDRARERVFRSAYSSELGEFVDHEVVDLSSLRPGEVVDGPCLIAQPETTAVVGASGTVTVAPTGHVVVDISYEGERER